MRHRSKRHRPVNLCQLARRRRITIAKLVTKWIANPLNIYLFEGENPDMSHDQESIDRNTFAWYWSNDSWTHWVVRRNPHHLMPFEPFKHYRVLRQDLWEDVEDGIQYPIEVSEENWEWREYRDDVREPSPLARDSSHYFEVEEERILMGHQTRTPFTHLHYGDDGYIDQGNYMVYFPWACYVDHSMPSTFDSDSDYESEEDTGPVIDYFV